MPILPHRRALYPRDWPQIRERIIRRAGGCCEGSPRFPDCRAKAGTSHPETGARVVLTVGHLNFDPQDCREGNLRAWCQKCHNAHDAKQRHCARMNERERLAEEHGQMLLIG
jgi:hypothetical protein